MTTIRNVIGLILLIILITITINAQQNDDIYNFPLKPGMPEWKELKTHEEMLKVLQLPANVIKAISTGSLIQTCLNYPLFSDMWAHDNIKKGFIQLRKDFAGFNELLNRKDALEELLKLYDKMDPNLISEKSTLLDKGRYTAEFCKIELILSQQELMKNSVLDKKNLLFKAIVKKHEEMLKYREFDIRSMESNIFLMGNILADLDLSVKLRMRNDDKVNNFINTSRGIEKNIIIEIISLSKEYLKTNKIGG